MNPPEHPDLLEKATSLIEKGQLAEAGIAILFDVALSMRDISFYLQEMCMRIAVIRPPSRNGNGNGNGLS